MVTSSTNAIEREDADDGPVVSAGERSPSTPTTGPAGTAQAAARPGPLAPGQRWSVAHKREVALRLLRGESVELLSRELGLPIVKLEQWRRKAEVAPKEREGNPADGELAAALRRIGELGMEVELLRARIERPGPLGRGRSR